MTDKKEIDRQEIRKRVIVMSYNDYLALYAEMEPALRRIFREEKMPFPDDPWKLINFVSLRLLEEGKYGNVKAELKDDDFIYASKMIEKAVREELHRKQLYELPAHILADIKEFSEYKQSPELCEQVLEELEVLKMNDNLPTTNKGRINKAGTCRKIESKLGIDDDKKESVKNWTHDYIDQKW
jgi:hypothetical protein